LLRARFLGGRVAHRPGGDPKLYDVSNYFDLRQRACDRNKYPSSASETYARKIII